MVIAHYSGVALQKYLKQPVQNGPARGMFSALTRLNLNCLQKSKLSPA